MGPEQPRTEQYYRYTDATGRVHLVSSLDSLPPEARAKAELLQLDPNVTRQEQTVVHTETPFQMQWPSFGIGFAAALALALAFRFMPQSMRWVSRLAVMAAIAALGIGLYLGLLRQSVGTGTGPLAAPSALIQDAKNAVEQVKERRRAQEAELKLLDEETHGKK